MLSLILETPEMADTVILNSLKEGLILFWLLYEKRAVRITPPLTITDEEITLACNTLTKVLDNT